MVQSSKGDRPGDRRAHHRERSSECGSFIVDRKGTILGFDLGMEQLTGWPAVEIVGRSTALGMEVSSVAARAASPPCSLLHGSLIPAVSSGVERVELRLGCRDGRTMDVDAVASCLPGVSERVTIHVLRVLARSACPPGLEESERHDPLTGLATRDAFRLRVERGLQSAARRACHVALLLVDVDNLRSINDRLGRPAGDDLLRRLAGILRATVGEEDHVARLADDDFAILLSGAGRGEARQTAARLRSTVERFRFFGVQGEEPAIKVTLSVGAASFPADAENVSDLLQRSQEALDEARTLGRNRVWCYTRRPRVPLRAPVYFDGGEPLLVGYMRDLSPSGIFVQTSDPIDIGMRCALVFPVPTSDAKVHIIGRIVRTVPLQDATADARAPGMGVEFEKIGSRDRRTIDAFLYEQESAGTRPGRGLLSF